MFSTITIQFVKDKDGRWKTIPAFLSSLVSGTNPYVRWARELQLRRLVPIQFGVDYWSEYDPWQGEDRETVLASQKEWLTPAIESLVQVERVRCVSLPLFSVTSLESLLSADSRLAQESLTVTYFARWRGCLVCRAWILCVTHILPSRMFRLQNFQTSTAFDWSIHR